MKQTFAEKKEEIITRLRDQFYSFQIIEEVSRPEVDRILYFISQSLDSYGQAVREEEGKYIAYCDCGDALERGDLYPTSALYHCVGCNKYCQLKLSTSPQEEELNDTDVAKCHCHCHYNCQGDVKNYKHDVISRCKCLQVHCIHCQPESEKNK